LRKLHATNKAPYPLSEAEWPEELNDIRSYLGKPLNIHNIMAHHPELMKAWTPFRNHVIGGSTLAPRHRELLILRTAFQCQTEYEWKHHVERGRLAGLTEDEIQRVKLGPGAKIWLAEESALLAAADDCHRQYCLTEETRLLLESHFSAQQQLDILVTAGMYMTLALIIKSYDVPMEDD
jgi:alkylhydroperoxidase family enzyme